jgi:TPR repeat protein
MYALVQGVVRNHEEAARFYRLAANHGNVGAQTYLGQMYGRGQGVPPSEAIAYAILSLPGANVFFGANIAILSLAEIRSAMSSAQIEAGDALSRELGKRDNFLKALDHYARQ